MGQCCSSKNKSNKKKNSQKVVATTTVPGPYYEDDYTAPVSPIRHMFTEPGPATPEESTEVVVNREALEAVTSRFCHCSVSTKCTHRPIVTPVRKPVYYKRYSEDLYMVRPMANQRSRRATLDLPSRRAEANLPNEYLSEDRYLSTDHWNLDIGEPIASSSRLDPVTSPSRFYPIASSSRLDPITSPSRLEPSASSSRINLDRTCSIHKSGMSWNLNNVTGPYEEGDEEGIYGYRFVPREHTIEFERSIIAWV